MNWVNLTDRCVEALLLAQAEARLLGDAEVGTEHVLIGLVLGGKTVGAQILEAAGVDAAVLRAFRGECSLATYLTVVARRVIVREMSRRRMAEALGHVNAHHSALDMASHERHEVQRIDNRDEIQCLGGF